jgi:fibronectin type 3 domain-containing protein
MYNIWLYDKNKGNGKPAKTDLSISEAFNYVSFAQENLKPNQQLITQEIKTGKVDMIFEKNSTTTPKMPMRFNKFGSLVIPNQMNDKSFRDSMPKSKPTSNMTDSEFWEWTTRGETLTKTEQKRFERLRTNNKFRKQAKSKPKMMKPKSKSRGKWVGNMFRLSNSRLSQLGKTGTTKQKKLAKSIIARRRKK